MPPIQYAQSGDVDIAYQVLGAGPPDVVFVAGFITHLRAYWGDPSYRRFCERLASFCRLIVFDKRGMGLSDRVRVGTLEERMDDVRAVMDAVGSERAALMGVSEGGPLSILFAATYPHRTQALVLCGGEVKEERTDDWPWGEATREEFEESMARVPETWGRGGEGIWRKIPSRGRDERLRTWWAGMLAEAASPRGAEAFMRLGFEIDVRHVAPAVAVPALILHTEGDRVCHVENARWLAQNLADARYVELPGADHVPWGEHAERVVGEIQEFLTGSRRDLEIDRVLTTVLFTDIVASTERAATLGDRRWAELLEAHHDLIRRELERFRGREVNTAGDGFIASFDGPARAIRCASAAVAGVRALGIELRAGIHTGECEVVDGQLGGLAVHIGARVTAHAKPSEVLVSQTVRDLVSGSGIELSERGVAQLKGVPGKWRLYAVAPRD